VLPAIDQSTGLRGEIQKKREMKEKKRRKSSGLESKVEKPEKSGECCRGMDKGEAI